MFSSISSCGTLRFAPWQWMPLWPWSMFNSISSCGTLRFAPWQWMPLWPWSMFRSIFFSFWPCGPSFPCILALWAFISLHFGLAGLHFLSFWPFRGQRLGPPPTSCQKWLVCPTSLQWIYQRRDRLHFAVFSILGLHFLVFWPCGPSFPCIFAFWAFISFHFVLFGVSFWAPPTSCQKWPVCPTSLQWIYQRRDRFHFAVFGLLGLHFLAFWPCGPSFACILALWAFISLHFGLVFGLHFLAFWPCGPSFPFILAFSGSASGPTPQVAKNGPFAQRPYNGFISAVTGSILQFLAFWAFISLHFGLVGLHFLAFWPCGPSFPCILALWAFISFHFGLFGVGFCAPPTSCQKWPVCPTSLQWIYQRRDRPHFAVFSAQGLHFLAFWPWGPSFPCILAFSGSASGPPPTSCQKWPVCPTSLQWIYQRRDRPHFAVFSTQGLHFLAFWPWGPSFPCILALWAFISLHFGLVGFHFLAFWPCGSELVGPPPTSCQKRPVFPMSHIKNLAAPGPASFSNFRPFGPSFPFILAFWALILHLAVPW